MESSIQQAYDNIEKILLYGFLTAGVSYGDHYFLFKNITNKEYENLCFYRGSDNAAEDVLYHLSFCTVFIDGCNLLEDRFVKIQDLKKFYKRMPISFVLRIRDVLKKLNTEYIDSLKFMEGFCYTDRSRYLWRVFDIRDSSRYTGIAGLENAGVNSVQENWIVINKRLDEEDVYDKELNLALMVASATNPKGTKVISRNHDFHKNELEELREDIAKYGYDRKRVEEQQEKAVWTAPLKSREDLVRELYRQMSGKKDRHDLFIEEWIKQQKAAAEKAKQQVEDRQREYRVKLQEVDLSSVEESKPITTSELNKILAKKKVSDIGPGVTQPIINVNDNEDKERFLKKISATVIRPGE